MEREVRCFVAIDLPAELKAMIADYLNTLKTVAPKVRWVKADSIHITLKFIGEVTQQSVQRIISSLHFAQGTVSPFEIRISTFGAFPSQRRPRVIWLGLEGIPQKSLYELQSQIEAKLEPLGFQPEKRRFSPHLTLGRNKLQTELPEVRNYLNKHPFPPYRFQVDSFNLMESQLKSSGAVYSVIHKYSLHAK